MKIVLYYLSQDNYINSIIFNGKFKKTVEIVRHDSHYNIVFSMKQIESFLMNYSLILDVLIIIFIIIYNIKYYKLYFFNINKNYFLKDCRKFTKSNAKN